jgi:hypothetical protein
MSIVCLFIVVNKSNWHDFRQAIALLSLTISIVLISLSIQRSKDTHEHWREKIIDMSNTCGHSCCAYSIQFDDEKRKVNVFIKIHTHMYIYTYISREQSNVSIICTASEFPFDDLNTKWNHRWLFNENERRNEQHERWMHFNQEHWSRCQSENNFELSPCLLMLSFVCLYRCMRSDTTTYLSIVDSIVYSYGSINDILLMYVSLVDDQIQ